jgi:two-component sensor histidine kinase
MPFGGPNSERALILAPRGRDAEIASKLLQEAGWPALICPDVGRLCDELDEGAAFAVVVEEVLSANALASLRRCIKKQPAWSDFPFVVLTTHGHTPERNELAIQFQDALGNVTFLERPFHPTTLVSVGRAALRSRRRQYQTRELLERRDLLARELQHRTKNLLSVIQAIASASLADSQGREAFFDRLHALARAQDLIIEGAGRGALMKEIVKNALESFGDRVSIEGPEVFLNPNTAQGFALLTHELATNAAKHGSLTTETGAVSVRWSVDVGATEPTVVFQWRESGGPPVRPPKRKGFGSVLLERAVATADGAAPRLDYSPEGFAYEVRATLAHQKSERMMTT